jgi:hypothetical protein
VSLTLMEEHKLLNCSRQKGLRKLYPFLPFVVWLLGNYRQFIMQKRAMSTVVPLLGNRLKRSSCGARAENNRKFVRGNIYIYRVSQKYVWKI